MESEVSSGEIAPVSKPARSRANLVLNIVIIGLIVALVGFGAYFGISAYRQAQVDKAANPAYRAVALWQDQVKKNPNDAQTRVRLAEALAAVGKTSEAATQLQTAIKLDPKRANAYLDLAQIAAQGKDYASAEGYLLKVVDLTAGDFSTQNPQREQAYYYLGEVALLQKHYDDAAGYYNAALRIKNSNADTYLGLAKAYDGLGETDAAISQLKIALLFDPKYAEAHYELGRLLLKKGDKLNAAVNLRYAAQLVPNQPEVEALLAELGTSQDWLSKANASLSGGNVEEAIKNVDVARALDPNDVSAALLEGKLLEKHGDTSGALLAYKDALKLASSNSEAKAGVVRTGMKEGKRLESGREYKAALAAYKDVLSADPKNAQAKSAVTRVTPLAKTSKK